MLLDRLWERLNSKHGASVGYYSVRRRLRCVVGAGRDLLILHAPNMRRRRSLFL